ncbi:hypothetical protein HGO97_018195 [Faecalicatena sp. AGMB00832]|uniref:Uncharacterized protein n=1 Tax=Faecalicatena faecalis TaxID=2726362 RepID=A0ABS6D8E8_9FIRM|nr:hypothetical protein [Faecalicatena faecalis]MBU3877739.1 hypothetical protein [Faecalicatena faecalis]
MFDSKEQLRTLKQIFVEEFEAKEDGLRGGGYSTLFEVTSIDGVEIPSDLKVVVNFDDGIKPVWSSVDNMHRVDENFKGNLNAFVLRKKKVLRRVHITLNQKTYKKRWDMCSLRGILESVE